MAGITAPGAPTVPPRAASISRHAIAAALGATILNSALWGLGRLLGIDFVVVPRGPSCSPPREAPRIAGGRAWLSPGWRSGS